MRAESADALVSRETTEISGRAPTGAVSRETAPFSSIYSTSHVSRETTSERPSPPARLFLVPLRAYRRFLSPALGARCRYYPSCSAYAEESIRDLGAIRGTLLAAWRVLRCNPLSRGGLDPVSERRFFRGSEGAHAHGGADTA